MVSNGHQLKMSLMTLFINNFYRENIRGSVKDLISEHWLQTAGPELLDRICTKTTKSITDIFNFNMYIKCSETNHKENTTV